VLRKHEDTEAIRKATKVHPDFRRLNDTMIAHGVQTGHAATAANGTVAIVSDILQWAGADPDMLDPASPLPKILEIYASRLILTPGQFGDRSRSKPGLPVRQVKHSDPEYYMFNEMGPSWGLKADAGGMPGVETVAVTGVVPAPETRSEPGQPPQQIEISPVDHPVVSKPVQKDVPPPSLPTPVEQVHEADEYALPQRVSASDAARLMVGGQRWVENDHDWPFELNYAIGPASKADPDVIAAVEAARAPVGTTPFRYFLETAKREGVKAGHAAYREATIRRFAFEFATKDEWQDVRRNLGLLW
jgi:hypothetical protein